MKKSTKGILIGIVAVVIIVILFFSGILYNTADDGVYIKINNKTYIANDADLYENITTEKIGTVEERCLPFIKPTKNGQSNGFPTGVSIYKGEQSTYIYVEEGKWFLKLNLEE